MRLDGSLPDSGTSKAPWRIYNIGSGKPLALMDVIHELEAIGKNAQYELLPMQPGDLSNLTLMLPR